MLENEAMLRRLQDQKSSYNVSLWEQERKKEIERVKQICVYKPSLIREEKIRIRRKGPGSNVEPNR